MPPLRIPVVAAPAPELPDEAELPITPEHKIGPTDGSAMLRIERTLDWGALGRWDMGADFAVTIGGDLVVGETESEATFAMIGVGATGISHTTNGVAPVHYEVRGVFYRVLCELHLTVTETLRISEMTAVNTALGALPGDPDAEDIVTTLDVEFDQQSRDFFIVAGGENAAAFTLYDVVLPDIEGCDFTG